MSSIFSQVEAANGAFLMFYSTGFGAGSMTPQQCQTYFSGYGYTNGYYVSGPPSQFTFPYFPFMAVIDLTTGELLGKDVDETNYLMPADIVGFVQQANGG